MATLVTLVIAVLAALVLVSLVLEHFGIVVLLGLGLVVVARYARRHGV
jgi:positive regulator of sigma E activity